MFGFFPWKYSSLLQTDVRYFKEDNPKEVMIILIVLGGIIFISIVVRIITHGLGGGSSMSSSRNRGSVVTPRNFNAFTLFRLSSAYGLSRDQSKLLEFVFRNGGVTDPEQAMRNPALLDRHFKKAYKTIERNSESDEEAQQRLASLFSLRNVIEASHGPANTVATPQLTENTQAILLYGNDSYPVKVLLSRGLNVITDIPRNALGTPLRIAKGAKISISFFTKSNKGYSIDGQIVGTGNTVRGPGLKIAHTGKMKPLVKRQFRRKQVTMKCELFTIHLEETGSGRKKTNKLVVDTKKYSGSVQDISSGGCAVKTGAPIQVGSRVKINFDYSGSFIISALGQVIRMNKSGYTGMILHIKFLKVPRRSYNSINSLVYGFDEDKP